MSSKNVKAATVANYCGAMEAETISKNGGKLRNGVQGKRCFALLAFLFLTTLAFAQSNLQDVVYLKNGSIIRGVIIEQVPNLSVKIQTVDRNVFVYQIDEIEKLTKEPYQGRSRNSSYSTGRGLKSGYRGIIEMGVTSFASSYGIIVNFINGYQFNPYFSLGLGVGNRYLSATDDFIFPIFTDFRVNFIDNIGSPYLSFGVGCSIDGSVVGSHFNSSAGVRFMISNKTAINMGLGIETQTFICENGLKYNYGSIINFVIGISF